MKVSFLTHFNRAFDPCSLSARHVSLGPAWNCQLMWSENGRRPLSASVGRKSYKEIWASVVFKHRRTHRDEGVVTFLSFRWQSKGGGQRTKEPSVKDA